MFNTPQRINFTLHSAGRASSAGARGAPADLPIPPRFSAPEVGFNDVRIGKVMDDNTPGRPMHPSVREALRTTAPREFSMSVQGMAASEIEFRTHSLNNTAFAPDLTVTIHVKRDGPGKWYMSQCKVRQTDGTETIERFQPPEQQEPPLYTRLPGYETASTIMRQLYASAEMMLGRSGAPAGSAEPHPATAPTSHIPPLGVVVGEAAFTQNMSVKELQTLAQVNRQFYRIFSPQLLDLAQLSWVVDRIVDDLYHKPQCGLSRELMDEMKTSVTAQSVRNLPAQAREEILQKLVDVVKDWLHAWGSTDPSMRDVILAVMMARIGGWPEPLRDAAVYTVVDNWFQSWEASTPPATDAELEAMAARIGGWPQPLWGAVMLAMCAHVEQEPLQSIRMSKCLLDLDTSVGNDKAQALLQMPLPADMDITAAQVREFIEESAQRPDPFRYVALQGALSVIGLGVPDLPAAQVAPSLPEAGGSVRTYLLDLVRQQAASLPAEERARIVERIEQM